MACMEYHTGDSWIKKCARCQIDYQAAAKTWAEAQKKFLEFFSPVITGRSSDDLDSWCKECHLNNKKGRSFNVRRKESLEAQDGKCGICEKEISFVYRTAYIDHDHKTGKFRKVLCNRCNVLMATLDDDEWLAKGLAYRDLHREDN